MDEDDSTSEAGPSDELDDDDDFEDTSGSTTQAEDGDNLYNFI